MNQNLSNTVYPIVRKSDETIVPQKAANKVVLTDGCGVGGGKGFD